MRSISWTQFFLIVFVWTAVVGLIGYGAGKMSNPAEQTTKSTTSVASSDQSVASNVAKSNSSESKKNATYKKKEFYPDGTLKSEVEKSVESVEKRYEQEIADLKIQIKLLESRTQFEQVTKYQQPQHMVTLLGGVFGEKSGLYQHQWLMPNLFLGGGGYTLPSGSGVLFGGSLLF